MEGLKRYVLTLLAVCLSVGVLYVGKDLFILGIISGLLAFLLLPMARKVEGIGLPRWAGALTATMLMLLLVIGVFFLWDGSFRDSATIFLPWNPRSRRRVGRCRPHRGHVPYQPA